MVIDLVAGERWGELAGGFKKRWVGMPPLVLSQDPLVELDVRTLYLKDLVLIGCTFQDRQVFQNLIGYIERNEITPSRFEDLSFKGYYYCSERLCIKEVCGQAGSFAQIKFNQQSTAVFIIMKS